MINGFQDLRYPYKPTILAGEMDILRKQANPAFLSMRKPKETI